VLEKSSFFLLNFVSTKKEFIYNDDDEFLKFLIFFF